MRSNQYVHASVGKTVEHSLPALALYDARKQFYANVHVAQKLFDCCQMLFRKDFRGSHDARLKAVVQGYKHGHQGDERLAAAYVSL